LTSTPFGSSQANTRRGSILGIFPGGPSALGRGIDARELQLAPRKLRALHLSQTVILNARQSNILALACYQKADFVIRLTGAKITATGRLFPFFRLQLKSGSPGARSCVQTGDGLPLAASSSDLSTLSNPPVTLAPAPIVAAKEGCSHLKVSPRFADCTHEADTFIQGGELRGGS
jgi:hypothetical protein